MEGTQTKLLDMIGWPAFSSVEHDAEYTCLIHSHFGAHRKIAISPHPFSEPSKGGRGFCKPGAQVSIKFCIVGNCRAKIGKSVNVFQGGVIDFRIASVRIFGHDDSLFRLTVKPNFEHESAKETRRD